MVLINAGFHTRKNFSENYPQFGHTPSKYSPALSYADKNLKNIGLEGSKIFAWPGHQIINLPGAPTCLVPVLTTMVENSPYLSVSL